ncbi:MAG: DedA family protein [Hydrogenophilales bacterium 17-62-8]|nr:MAG: DedA family protein [Hydrogenophilales bacterium 17-62-8]
MRPYTRLFAVILFLAVLLALFELSGLREHLSLTYLQQTLADHPIGGLLVFILVFALGNLVQIPGWVFLAAAVLALGRTWGGLVTYIAAILSCSLTFFAIRLIGGDALRNMNGKLATRLLSKLDAHPIKNIVLLRTLFQTAPVLNYALAMSGVRFRDYLAGTLLGLPLPIAMYCLFFDFLAMQLQLA